jgi:hypothetical protein
MKMANITLAIMFTRPRQVVYLAAADLFGS